MSEFGNWRLCSPEEYGEGKKNGPVLPGELQVGSPYIWMVAFDEGAGRQPVSIEDKDYDEKLGLHVVRFASTTSDQVESGHFHPGGRFIQGTEKELPLYFHIPGGLQVRVEESYFKEDDQAFGSTGDIPDPEIVEVITRLEEHANRPPVAV